MFDHIPAQNKYTGRHQVGAMLHTWDHVCNVDMWHQRHEHDLLVSIRQDRMMQRESSNIWPNHDSLLSNLRGMCTACITPGRQVDPFVSELVSVSQPRCFDDIHASNMVFVWFDRSRPQT